jgi:tetratricopeptide (TPR) repeat protein
LSTAFNPCLSIASTPRPAKISAFCRNELQKTGYDRVSLLTNDLDSMIANGKVESSVAQINKIIDTALTSKSKSLSDDLGRLLGDNFTWRQNSQIERLIKLTPKAKRNLILPMLDNISGRIQGLDASYSSMKIKALTQLASIYHSLGAKDKPGVLLNQAVQISPGVRLTEMRATLLIRVAQNYIDIGQPALAQKTLAQSYQVALQFDKETKDKNREFHPSYLIAYIYTELGNFDRALDVTKSISNRLRQDETLGAIAGQYIKINQLEQAQKLLPAIISEREKAKLLGQLAVAYSRIKNLNLADQLFNQAVKFASANILNDFYLAEIIEAELTGILELDRIFTLLNAKIIADS